MRFVADNKALFDALRSGLKDHAILIIRWLWPCSCSFFTHEKDRS